MKIQVNLSNNSTVWDKNARYKVREVVIHNGNYFVNKTGVNSQPQKVGDKNWLYVSTIAPVKQSGLMIASKGAGNLSDEIQIGDIVYGMLPDETTFVPFGKYIGGDLDSISSFVANPLEF